MNSDAEAKISKLASNKAITVSLAAFTLVMLIVAGLVLFSVLGGNKIHKGVYVNDLDATGMTKEALTEALNERFLNNTGNMVITLQSGSKTEGLSFSDIGVTYNIADTVEKAYSTGRTGNIVKRLKDIVNTGRNPQKIELEVSFDRQKAADKVEALYNETLVNVKEADLLVQNNRVVIRSGHHGEHIDKNSILNEIEKRVQTYQDGVINAAVVQTPPSRINVDDYMAKITQEPKDATVVTGSGGVEIVPHVVGRSIDREVLANIASELEKTEDTEREVPVVYTMPRIQTETLKGGMFKDVLYSASTQFYTGTQNDANRGVNIRKAVSSINGLVLAPGDVFSFNGVVGPRSEEAGYKVAHVYSEGRIVDDVGGGICQVSTTLYNAVLYSDLAVLARTNHMFTVGYIALGSDAAVSYDQPDFKFMNSTSWPIKIEGYVTDNNVIIFTIRGTNENPGKSVEIYSPIIQAVDFSTVYIDDPTLAEGAEVFMQEGMMGYVVDTYKIIKQDGQVVSENKLYTSYYQPLNREIRRGTQKG